MQFGRTQFYTFEVWLPNASVAVLRLDVCSSWMQWPWRAGLVRFLLVMCPMEGAHKRTLERALQVAKTKERLAVALEVPLEELESYMAGEKPVPNQAFILALDIVANGRDQKK